MVELRGRVIADVGVELHAKTAKYNAILENTTQGFQCLTKAGIVIISRMGDIIEVNKAARDMLGEQAKNFGSSRLDAVYITIAYSTQVNEDGSKFEREQDPLSSALHSSKAVKNVLMGVKSTPDDVAWVAVSAFPVPNDSQHFLVTISNACENFESDHRDEQPSVRKLNDVEDDAPDQTEVDEENEKVCEPQTHLMHLAVCNAQCYS